MNVAVKLLYFSCEIYWQKVNFPLIYIFLDLSFLLFIAHPYCTWQLQAKLERIYLKRLYAHTAIHTQQMFHSSKSSNSGKALSHRFFKN